MEERTQKEGTMERRNRGMKKSQKERTMEEMNNRTNHRMMESQKE